MRQITKNHEPKSWKLFFLSLQTAEEAERGQSHQAARGSLWCPGEAGWRVSHVAVQSEAHLGPDRSKVSLCLYLRVILVCVSHPGPLRISVLVSASFHLCSCQTSGSTPSVACQHCLFISCFSMCFLFWAADWLLACTRHSWFQTFLNDPATNQSHSVLLDFCNKDVLLVTLVLMKLFFSYPFSFMLISQLFLTRASSVKVRKTVGGKVMK